MTDILFSAPVFAYGICIVFFFVVITSLGINIELFLTPSFLYYACLFNQFNLFLMY